MIYKYTKCESVIAKIMADSDMSEKNIRITDIREWIFEAVEKIGAPVLYVLKESGIDGVPVFDIKEYQIPIPDDLESLTAVAYSTTGNEWVPCRKNESTFKNFGLEPSAKYHHEPELSKAYKFMHHRSLLTEINRSEAVMNLLKNNKLDEPTYWIKPGWIVFNKLEGKVKLSYKAVATDERGYPLIPDLASYQEAIYWYVMMKLNFPKFIKGLLGGRVKFNLNIYFYLQQQWNFYRNLAYAESMMPNEGEMTNIKNEWTKLIPDWDSDDTFFRNVGKKLLNYNDYYYGY